MFKERLHESQRRVNCVIQDMDNHLVIYRWIPYIHTIEEYHPIKEHYLFPSVLGRKGPSLVLQTATEVCSVEFHTQDRADPSTLPHESKRHFTGHLPF